MGGRRLLGDLGVVSVRSSAGFSGRKEPLVLRREGLLSLVVGLSQSSTALEVVVPQSSSKRSLPRLVGRELLRRRVILSLGSDLSPLLRRSIRRGSSS